MKDATEQLYTYNEPVCIACSDRRDAGERLSKIPPQWEILSNAEIQRIESRLLEDMEAAGTEYAEAVRHCREAVSTDHEIECADGTFGVRHAVSSEGGA